MKRVAEKDSIKRKEIYERTKEQPDGDYLVEVKRYWLKTDAQQGYYWGVVLETLAKETWYSWVQLFEVSGVPIAMDWKEYLHGMIKGLLHKQTSRNMTKFEYSELIETAIEVARQMWIYIPPAETWKS